MLAPLPRSSPPRFLAAALLALVTARLPAEETAAEAVIELPPLVVSESTKAPAWLYLALPDAEILSGCKATTTQEFARGSQRMMAILDTLIPPDLRARHGTPRIHVLVTEAQLQKLPDDVIAELLRGQKSDVVNKENAELLRQHLAESVTRNTGTYNDPLARTNYAAPRPPPVRFLPNLRLNDPDLTAIFAVIEEWTFDARTLKLTPDWLRLMLETRTPPLPGWFVGTMVEMHQAMSATDTALTLPALTWVSSVETQVIRQNPKAAHKLIPLAELFAGRPAGDPALEDYAARRLAQFRLFVRWAFDDATGARKAALWKFVAAAALGAPTDDQFQAAFGFGYTEARQQLNDYLPRALRSALRLKLDLRTLPAVPKARPATREEISRLQGEWERLQANYVKAHQPRFLAKYAEQAQRTLSHAYASGDREPRLLAAIGLFECDRGDRAQARSFLEAAVQGGIARPRVYTELAAMRLAAAQAGASPLDQAQLAEVLRPLFAGRAHAPALPETYRLIADAWTLSATPPERKHLAVLDEGLRLFPNDVPLVHRTAALYAKYGFAAEAASLADYGLRLAGDDGTRQKFQALKAEAIRH